MTTTSRPETSPWVLNLRDIGLAQGYGTARVHALDFTAPAPDDVISGVLQVPADAPVRILGRAESVAEGVMVSATVSATAVGSCSRCLADITVPIEAHLRELYAYPESATAATTDADEVSRVQDDLVDLAEAVHDELVLAMPTVPLCRPDCPGLCPVCGERLDDVADDHRHEILDPRWAALPGLLDRMTKES